MLSRLTILLLFISFYSNAQKLETLSIYIDCSEWICDKPYFKQELENVTFVRDQSDADVHIFFVTQRAANKGRAFEIEFIGQNKYSKLHDILKFDIYGNMTELESSDKILKYLRFGLMRFWIENGIGEELTVSIKENDSEDTKEDIDPWNKWSFSLEANGWFNGQESTSFSNINASVSAEQVTDKNKFRIRMGVSQNRSVFTFENEKTVFNRQRNYISVRDVITINSNWSAGIFSRLGSSVFGNYTFYGEIEPGIEYNFFPYDVSSKKQLVLFYKVGSRYNNYIETTSFGKESELLWQQSLGIGGIIKRKWGDFEGSIVYENFLHQFSLNTFDFFMYKHSTFQRNVFRI